MKMLTTWGFPSPNRVTVTMQLMQVLVYSCLLEEVRLIRVGDASAIEALLKK